MFNNKIGGSIINNITWIGKYNTNKIEDFNDIHIGCFIGTYKKDDLEINGRWVGFWKNNNFYGFFIKNKNKNMYYINIINGIWTIDSKNIENNNIVINGNFNYTGDNFKDNSITKANNDNISHLILLENK